MAVAALSGWPAQPSRPLWPALAHHDNASRIVMTTLSPKWRDRMLYLISPIGLLAVWQLLLMAGFGDRRFIPAPSDISAKFWELTLSGELATNTGVTLWRVFAGYIIGAVPAVV